MRARIAFADAEQISEAQALLGADVLVLASEGLRTIPGTLVRALAAGVIPVAARLPVYEELLADGEYGDGFIPGDIETLASHLTRLVVRASPRAIPRS